MISQQITQIEGFLIDNKYILPKPKVQSVIHLPDYTRFYADLARRNPKPPANTISGLLNN